MDQLVLDLDCCINALNCGLLILWQSFNHAFVFIRQLLTFCLILFCQLHVVLIVVVLFIMIAFIIYSARQPNYMPELAKGVAGSRVNPYLSGSIDLGQVNGAQTH